MPLKKCIFWWFEGICLFLRFLHPRFRFSNPKKPAIVKILVRLAISQRLVHLACSTGADSVRELTKDLSYFYVCFRNKNFTDFFLACILLSFLPWFYEPAILSKNNLNSKIIVITAKCWVQLYINDSKWDYNLLIFNS